MKNVLPIFRNFSIANSQFYHLNLRFKFPISLTMLLIIDYVYLETLHTLHSLTTWHQLFVQVTNKFSIISANFKINIKIMDI